MLLSSLLYTPTNSTMSQSSDEAHYERAEREALRTLRGRVEHQPLDWFGGEAAAFMPAEDKEAPAKADEGGEQFSGLVWLS